MKCNVETVICGMELARRPPRTRLAYGAEIIHSENDSSDPYADKRHKRQRTEPSSSTGHADVTSRAVGSPIREQPPMDSNSSHAASSSQARTQLVTEAAIVTYPEASDATTLGTGPGVPFTRVPARAYDARFASSAVCVCAEHHTVHEAVQQLVGAVRNTAAILTLLHSKEPVEHQCALLGRMFEFDGFLGCVNSLVVSWTCGNRLMAIVAPYLLCSQRLNRLRT